MHKYGNIYDRYPILLNTTVVIKTEFNHITTT